MIIQVLDSAFITMGGAFLTSLFITVPSDLALYTVWALTFLVVAQMKIKTYGVGCEDKIDCRKEFMLASLFQVLKLSLMDIKSNLIKLTLSKPSKHQAYSIWMPILLTIWMHKSKPRWTLSATSHLASIQTSIKTSIKLHNTSVPNIGQTNEHKLEGRGGNAPSTETCHP